MRPLSTQLNAATLHIASRLFPCGFDVTMDEGEAPDTLERLNAHIAATGRMLVWGGASDQTIFADREVNWAFRAWHDFHHWKGQFAFDPLGEALTASRQIDDLFRIRIWERHMCHMGQLIDAEVCGQVAYARHHGGAFPVNQRAFVSHYLVNPLAAVVTDY